MAKEITRLIVGPVATNCWIYPLDENKAAVIDPGDKAERIISKLEKLNLVPAYILLTHGHFDHITAVPDLKEHFKSFNPQIAIHRCDAHYLGPYAYTPHIESLKAVSGSLSLLRSFLPAGRKELPLPDIILEEGDTVGCFTVMHLPGHTRGSAAFWDKEENIIFTGDTLFKGTYGRTDLPGGSEQELIESLRRLFKMDKNIAVYPGHDEITTIGLEAAGIQIF